VLDEPSPDVRVLPSGEGSRLGRGVVVDHELLVLVGLNGTEPITSNEMSNGANGGRSEGKEKEADLVSGELSIGLDDVVRDEPVPKLGLGPGGPHCKIKDNGWESASARKEREKKKKRRTVVGGREVVVLHGGEHRVSGLLGVGLDDMVSLEPVSEVGVRPGLVGGIVGVGEGLLNGGEHVVPLHDSLQRETRRPVSFQGRHAGEKKGEKGGADLGLNETLSLEVAPELAVGPARVDVVPRVLGSVNEGAGSRVGSRRDRARGILDGIGSSRSTGRDGGRTLRGGRRGASTGVVGGRRGRSVASNAC
jgi:hypothetical protein